MPIVLQHMQINRGFESLGVAPNGKIYAMLESVLDINGETKKIAQFIRILELDPLSGKVRMFAYPLHNNHPNEQVQIKVNDLAVITDSKFLVTEQVVDQDKKISHIFYKVDLKDASDISHIKLTDGKDLEYGRVSELQNVQMVKKEILLTAEKYDWPYEKLEGLAIIDHKTIAITNDNDFGISNIAIDKKCITKEHNIIKAVTSDLHTATVIWIISLEKNLTA